MTLITIQNFIDPHDAQVCKGKLESEGIECFIKNTEAIAAIPLMSVGMGGHELQCKEEDVERAKDILSN